jgi:hypothetical protein
MYAQLTYFDGPRSAELVAASERAGRERIQPAIEADPQMSANLVALFVLRQPDGGEVVVSVVKNRDDLDRAVEVIMGTELLPGEDPALLRDPDRIAIYEVIQSRQAVGQPS